MPKPIDLLSTNKNELAVLPVDFDPHEYLSVNDDVRIAGVDPVEHYLTYGITEGRAYKRQATPEGVFDYDGLRSIHNHEFMEDPDFRRAYDRAVQAAGGLEYRWYWRVHIGLWAANVASKLTGDFVECGVNYGCLSSAIMEYLDWNTMGRNFYLLDTFSGLDERYIGESDLLSGAIEKSNDALKSGTYTCDIDSVRDNFSEWASHISIIQGAIPETLNRIEAEKIAFLHIDLNCAMPEVAALTYLWDRIEPGAPILLDDYAYFGYRPQKLAMDKFAQTKAVAIASLPTGQGLILKPPA
jgi:hypothetical protein